jgi:8-oxo-dGTP pyrophosphatase MutT (NUDIX family)
VISLAEIRDALRGTTPLLLDTYGKRHAAVALVLRATSQGPELLFIERAEREGDPWSGHMAFPGGRVERLDPNPRFAAERETLEEVGLTLGDAEDLGRLDDLEGRHAGRPVELVISAFVYGVDEPGPLRTSREVREALWVPLERLRDPARHVDYAYPPARGALYPGIVVGDPERHVVWGLTYRFLQIFFDRIDRALRPE